MKKLLILSGDYTQIPAIKKAREMGHYVITCDYIEDNPGHQFANEYFNISNTDKRAVLQLARSLKIDGIVSFASDAAVLTVAYVAENLGLPTNPYKSVEILSNKDKFREFLKEHNFNVPRAKAYHSIVEAEADFHNFKMPVMIKPVDSSASRGISKIDSIDLLPDKAEYALSFSRVKRFIIEEYIEKHGYQVGGDGFSVNGKLVFHCFSSQYFPSLLLAVNPFVSIGGSWPNNMQESMRKKIHDEIQRVLELLNMKTGAYNFDIQIDERENIYLIEINARNGGNLIPHLIQYATGIDMIEYTIKAALGEDCSDLTMIETKGYWSSYIINSQKSGILKDIEMDDEFKKNNIVEYDLQIKPGEPIAAFTGSNAKLGTMVLSYSSMDEMLEKMKNITKLVKVIVE